MLLYFCPNALKHGEPSTNVVTLHLHFPPLCQPLKALLLPFTSPLIHCYISEVKELGARLYAEAQAGHGMP